MVLAKGKFLGVDGLVEGGDMLSPNGLREMLPCANPDDLPRSCVSNGTSRLSLKPSHYHVSLMVGLRYDTWLMCLSL